MKRIVGQPPRHPGPTGFESWLIPETITDSQGREYQVQELLDQCRRNYRSTMLKKKPRLAHHNWTPAEMQWINDNTLEAVQCRFGLTYKQAQGLQWRCRTRLRELHILDN